MRFQRLVRRRFADGGRSACRLGTGGRTVRAPLAVQRRLLPFVPRQVALTATIATCGRKPVSDASTYASSMKANAVSIPYLIQLVLLRTVLFTEFRINPRNYRNVHNTCREFRINNIYF